MHSHAGKQAGQKTTPQPAQKKATQKAMAVSPLQFSDQREQSSQQGLQGSADNSDQVQQLKSYQAMADNTPRQQPFTQLPVQRKNNTGLPDELKSGIENLSGHSLDDTRVHYNSSKPAQLNAHAYAQGTDIHLAPGQEKHLPHEAWHVVQQKQGRVKPTTMLKGKTAVNDDAGLEREADVMGAKAMQLKPMEAGKLTTIKAGSSPRGDVAQRVLVPFKTPAAPDANELLIAADAATIEALTAAAYTNTWNHLNGGVALDKSMFPGVTDGHFANFANVITGNDNVLKAAVTGYVIEDQVSNHAGLPAAAAAQVVSGNARPDFVITHGNRRGIVDITSSGQQGHVLNKKFSHSGYSYISEATYQSINFNALNGGAAPVLGGTAATLARKARFLQANKYVRSRLSTIKAMMRLHQTGVMMRSMRYMRESENTKDAINALPIGEKWNGRAVYRVNSGIGTLNGMLKSAGVLRLSTLTAIIEDARTKYMIPKGLPEWK